MPCIFLLHKFQMETANISTGTRFYVMAVTPTRLYSFTGIGSLDVSLNVIHVLHVWLSQPQNIIRNRYVCQIDSSKKKKSLPNRGSSSFDLEVRLKT